MFGAFPEHGLVNALSEGDKAKLAADTLARMRHFSRSLGLKGCFLELAHVHEPFAQSMLNHIREYRL